MYKSIAGLFAGTLLISTAAVATLPPPTQEMLAAATAKKVQEKILLEIEQEHLSRVQDRLAARFGTGNGTNAGETDKAKMPVTTSTLPGDVGPTPTNPQSGEAHSAPAK